MEDRDDDVMLEIAIDTLSKREFEERKTIMHSIIMTVFTEDEWKELMRVGFPTGKFVSVSPLRT